MEVSSYQLEDSSFLRPFGACVLNITPDHIDHHGTMSGYIAAKAKIFRRQRKSDFCVFNYDDKLCRRLARRCPSRVLFFSSSKRGGKLNAWIEEGTEAQRPKGTKPQRRRGAKIVFSFNGRKTSAAPPALPGRHNLENAMCAGLMALAAGADTGSLRRAFRAFKGVEHRLEPAGTVKGIAFINDSKATNVDSTLTALKALGGRKNIWLILGGLDKGGPYKPLAPYIRACVKRVLTIGSAAAKIERELAGLPVTSCGTMTKAAAEALKSGERGDIALLSPACASFDQFRDFEDRGAKFKALARGFKNGFTLKKIKAAL